MVLASNWRAACDSISFCYSTYVYTSLFSIFISNQIFGLPLAFHGQVKGTHHFSPQCQGGSIMIEFCSILPRETIVCNVKTRCFPCTSKWSWHLIINHSIIFMTSYGHRIYFIYFSCSYNLLLLNFTNIQGK